MRALRSLPVGTLPPWLLLQGFDLVLQVIALLGVVSVVTVEATIVLVVTFLNLSPYRVGGFEESFLPDLEEDLGPGRVEQNVGEPRNNLFGSFRPLPLESG
ncbi:hypothetical protein BHE74_00047731 [Ensete ventricosum]|nr:hypothetical protein BHE74_00047731 [Ensete ventricosum]RZS24670.1 hypothetical protein BHM03_00057768 [Ensete ventricosum]